MSRWSIVLFAAGGAVVFASAPGAVHPGLWVAVAVIVVAALVAPGRTIAQLPAPVVIGLAALAPLGPAIIAVVLVLAGLAWTVYRSRDDRDRTDLVPLGLAAIGIVLVLLVIGGGRLDPDVDDRAAPPTELDAELAESLYEYLDADRGVPFDIDYEPMSRPMIGDLGYVGEVSAFAVEQPQLADPASSETRFTDPPWWLVVLLLVAGLITLRALHRARTLSLVGPGGGASNGFDPLGWYDGLVAGAGHPRSPNEPLLAHGRRVADETGDRRYRTLARLVSDTVYSGRPLPEDAFGLFSERGD